MESSKEKIEAQLCAYIDGALGPAERAEIERHLATNSQHKALIAELRRQSGLLQDLPKVKAPPELNEALCGQLERSALLDPAEDDSPDAILSINRWPQITAIAAVLMLAVGLGVVVYYVLPPSPTRGPVALGTTNPTPEVEIGQQGKVGSGSGTPALRGHALADSSPKGKDTAGIDARSKGALDAGAGIDPSLVRNNNYGLITAKEVELLRKKTSEKGYEAENPSLYLVVAAENPAQAAKEVTAYFRSNNILYMSYDENAPHGGAGGAGGLAGGGGESRSTGTTNLNATPGKPLDDSISKAKPLPTEKSALSERGAPAAAKDQNRQGLSFEEQAKVRDSEPLAPAREPQEEALQDKAKQAAPPAPSPLASANTPKPQAAAEGPGRTESQRPGQADAIRYDRAYARGGADHTESNRESAGRNLDALGDRNAARKVAPESEGYDQQDLKLGADLTADKAPASLNGIYRARMNRRQADELSAILSRQQGQHAALTYSPAYGVPASAGAATDLNYKSTTDTYAFAPSKDGTAGSRPKAEAENGARQGDIRDADAIHGEQAKTSPSAPAVLQQQVSPTPADRKETVAGAAAKPGGEVQVKEAAVSAAQGQRRAAAMTQPSQRPENWNSQGQFGQQIGGQKSDAMSLQTDPQEEPVDVLIVVKQESPVSGRGLQLSAQPTTRPAAGPVDPEKKK